MVHVPVMVTQVMKYLSPKPGEHFVDCTLGDGGHTKRILELTAPEGKVLGLDLDAQAIKQVTETFGNFGGRLIAINTNFINLKTVVEREKFGPISGVLLDLGFSSEHIEKRGRGFTFMRDEPLDMRYANEASGQTAADIVNSWSQDELTQMIARYGEERWAADIAAAIVAARRSAPIGTTLKLVEIIKNSVPRNYEHGRLHPATRTFQAIRIAVNDELGNIKKVLPQAVEVAKTGGSIVTIAFHSLEDRLCKEFFEEQKQFGKVEILTPKPVMAAAKEIKENPRARSAKLRAVQKK